MKRIYFFRSNLKNHFFLYYSWVEAALTEGVDVVMFTVLTKQQLSSQLEEYHNVKSLKNVEILISPHSLLNGIYIFFYLLKNIFLSKNVSVIAKKVNLNALKFVRFLFPRRLRYSIELEGDAVSELDYLKKNIYEKGFYDKYIKSAEKSINILTNRIKKADGVLVLSSGFKKLLLHRHDFLRKENIKVISTGFIKNRISYNLEKRKEVRNSLNIGNETCFLYAGNLYYSWQNIKRTLEFFHYYNVNIDSEAKFIILTHESDQFIANKFIIEIGINENNIIMKEVKNNAISGYYNAADICVLLRDDDVMNEVASPGKIGEYAASGTPILTSSYIGDYSKILKKQKSVAQIDDTSNFESMSEEVIQLLKLTDTDKSEFSTWSNKYLSSQYKAKSFIDAF